MTNKFTLTIAIASLATLGAISVPAHAADAVRPPASSKTNSHGGKCASGKCGTEKIYSKAVIDKDPQGRLVRARDGKCGLTAEGYAVEATPRKKLAEGVCGQ
jgi:uncharacterized low-complexity protein